MSDEKEEIITPLYDVMNPMKYDHYLQFIVESVYCLQAYFPRRSYGNGVPNLIITFPYPLFDRLKSHAEFYQYKCAYDLLLFKHTYMGNHVSDPGKSFLTICNAAYQFGYERKIVIYHIDYIIDCNPDFKKELNL